MAAQTKIATKLKAVYTLEEVAKHNSRTDCWLIIGKSVYDVTKFIPYHPGGEVLLGHAGHKATDVFSAFHPSSVYKKLENYSIGELEHNVDTPLEKDLRQARIDMENAGLFQSSMVYYLLWQLPVNIMILGVILPLFLIMYSQSFWIHMLSAAVIAFGWQQAGWLGHDFAHHQVFKNRSINNVVGIVVIGLVTGFSLGWWKEKHNVHHATPNHIDYDNDIDTLPYLAWSDKVLHRLDVNNPITRFLITYQEITLFPLLCIARFSWMIQSIIFVLRHQVPLQFFSVFGHYIFFGYLLYLLPNTQERLIYFCLAETLSSIILSSSFILNHSGRPCINDKDFDQMDFFSQQVVTGRDIYSSTLVDWFTGGLNRQIEHHMFPTLPRHNFGKAEKILLPILDKHHIYYHKSGFFQGLSEILKSLRQISDAAENSFKKTADL
jgi:fatty acid desaturase/predicted heme/steroid binding protein